MQSSRAYLVRGLHEWILDQGWTPHVVVDAEIRGVMVPEQFVNDGQIVLNISPSAVQGLMIDNDAISFSARFGGVPMNIYAPMVSVLAVYARENGKGMGFGAEPGVEAFDLPPEPDDEPPAPSGPEKPSGRPSLKVVK